MITQDDIEATATALSIAWLTKNLANDFGAREMAMEIVRRLRPFGFEAPEDWQACAAVAELALGGPTGRYSSTLYWVKCNLSDLIGAPNREFHLDDDP